MHGLGGYEEMELCDKYCMSLVNGLKVMGMVSGLW